LAENSDFIDWKDFWHVIKRNPLKTLHMKTFSNASCFLAIFLSVTLSSCSVIGGIFKTGMGVGIFTVVVVLVIIGIVVARSRGGK